MIQTLFGSVEQEPTLLEKLKSGVQKTRDGLVSRIEDVISGRKEIDADLLEELEYTLIGADIGVTTTNEILDRIRERVDRKLVSCFRISLYCSSLENRWPAVPSPFWIGTSVWSTCTAKS